MEIIQWIAFENTDQAENIINEIKNEDFDTEITTKDAISISKMQLSVGYNALLVRNMEEYLCDAEVYVLTWADEASEEGSMFKLDSFNLEEIIISVVLLSNNKHCKRECPIIVLNSL